MNLIKKLEKQSIQARKIIIDIASSDVGCHLGGSLSVIDLLVCLFNKYEQKNNCIVLSKGHAAAALYSVMYTTGLIQEDPSISYGNKDSFFTGHPNHLIPNIPFSTGSLGHGVGYAVGWALANKIRNKAGLGICVGGDGELQEGLCWEVMQIVSSKEINNFIYIIDRNGAQNDGYTKEISEIKNIRQRFESYGCTVSKIDGHSHSQILSALNNKTAKPLVIIANTIKGKGIKKIEGNPNNHYVKLDKARAKEWKGEIDGTFSTRCL
jgi:transketolase